MFDFFHEHFVFFKNFDLIWNNNDRFEFIDWTEKKLLLWLFYLIKCQKKMFFDINQQILWTFSDSTCLYISALLSTTERFWNWTKNFFVSWNLFLRLEAFFFFSSMLFWMILNWKNAREVGLGVWVWGTCMHNVVC